MIGLHASARERWRAPGHRQPGARLGVPSLRARLRHRAPRSPKRRAPCLRITNCHATPAVRRAAPAARRALRAGLRAVLFPRRAWSVQDSTPRAACVLLGRAARCVSLFSLLRCRGAAPPRTAAASPGPASPLQDKYCQCVLLAECEHHGMRDAAQAAAWARGETRAPRHRRLTDCLAPRSPLCGAQARMRPPSARASTAVATVRVEQGVHLRGVGESSGGVCFVDCPDARARLSPLACAQVTAARMARACATKAPRARPARRLAPA